MRLPIAQTTLALAVFSALAIVVMAVTSEAGLATSPATSTPSIAPSPHTSPIAVLNAQTVSAKWDDGTTVMESDFFGPTVLDYSSVDAMFDSLESTLGTVYRLEVTFDPTYGHPTAIDIDPIHNLADEENYLRVTNFTVIDPTAFPPTGGRP